MANINHLSKKDISNLREFSKIGSFEETTLIIHEKRKGKC